MAFEGRNLPVNTLLLSLAFLASTFKCCGFLLSLLMLQRFRQRQYMVTLANPGLPGYPTFKVGLHLNFAEKLVFRFSLKSATLTI